MLEELSKQLMGIKGKLRMREKLRQTLDGGQKSLEREKARLRKFEAELQKESSDVEKLEGLSITGVFHAILGDKDVRLRKERREFLSAKLKRDECSDSVSVLEGEVAGLQNQIEQFGDLDSQYESILHKKEKLIEQAKNDNTKRLISFSKELADAQSDMRKIQEVINAGGAVLSELENMKASLKRASNWGPLDMVDEGTIETVAKHSKIYKAKDSVPRVQQLLRHFERELSDLGTKPDVVIDIGLFAAYADFFLDELTVDWLIQSRVERSLGNVAKVMEQVLGINRELQKGLQEAQKKSDDVEKQRRMLIENV